MTESTSEGETYDFPCESEPESEMEVFSDNCGDFKNEIVTWK